MLRSSELLFHGFLLIITGNLSPHDAGALQKGEGMSIRSLAGMWLLAQQRGSGRSAPGGAGQGAAARAPRLTACFLLLGRELQADGEADRRWPPPVQRPHELPARAGAHREGICPAAHRVGPALEAARGEG